MHHRWFVAAGNGAAKLDYSLDHFVRGFEHHELLPARHRDHGIRCNLNVLNQIRIQHQRDVVDAREPDHGDAHLSYRPVELECERVES